MTNINKLVLDKLEIENPSSETKLQLIKVCELEDKFIKGMSKKKWKEYFDLEIEKGQLHSIEVDHIIELTFQICKELFC